MESSFNTVWSEVKNNPRTVALLGPAFVAAVAYVDPGNVAANITAGARYGFTLVWVLVLANAMSVIVQYQSAKLGIVTGKSLPQILHDRLSPKARIAYWFQAQVTAIATDLAEIIGGAVALNLLFDVPLLLGGVIVGAVSMLLLSAQSTRRQHIFERVVLGLLLVITFGFITGLFVNPPGLNDVAQGLVPSFSGPDSVLVAASMLGATVMPHAIYLHSSLVGHRFGKTEQEVPKLLKVTRVDVISSLILAGSVNIALLLLAANSLQDPSLPNTDTLQGAHDAISQGLGPGIAVIFSIGLLASGLASTSVGSYAGAEILKGLFNANIPLWVSRLSTLVPALIILLFTQEPTWALVVSQAVLSVTIPFAIIPLHRFTGSAELMGEHRDNPILRIVSTVIALVVVVLNAVLIYLTIF